ncbi:MAG TPA: tetratricopeptide repeat protein [Pirellulales bacterium]|nr:tetratricopeptide repeat protein [Pirellulales bacterium]
MKALEKDRNRRYETPSGLAADVRHYLDDEPVLACPPSASYRLRKFAHRNKIALGVTGLVLFFLLLMGSGFGWALRDRAAREAELATETASRRARLNLEVEHVLDDATKAHDAALTPTDDPHELEAAVNKAEYILQRAKGLAAQDETATLPSIRERIEALKVRVSAARRDAQMLNELENIRLRPADSKNGEMWDWAGAEEQYASAFKAYGLDPAMKPAQTAALVRESPIREALLGGLDAWLQLRKEQPAPIVTSTQSSGRSDDSSVTSLPLDDTRTWLREVADGADDNTWRRTLRQAVLDGDVKRLRSLVSEAETLKQPPHVLARLGSVLDAAGLHNEAETVLRQAQVRYPGDFWTNYNLGHLLIFASPASPVEAIGYFRAAVAIRPRSAEARSILGLAFHLNGDNDRAIVEFQQAIALDPLFAIAHNNLGTALRVKGNLVESIAEHQEALRLKPDFPDAHYFLGLALSEKRQVEESIEEFSKCLEMDPKNVSAWVSRAQAYAKAHQNDKAFADFSKALELDPNNRLIRMTRERLGREKLDARLAASRLAVAVAPRSTSAQCGLGDALLQRGIFNEAEAAFEKAVELDPESAVAHCGLGRALLHQGDFRKAVAELRRSDEIDPTLLARCELAEALVQQGRIGDALAELHSAIQLQPTDPSPYRHLARHLATCTDLKYRDTDKALKLAQKSVSLDPQGGSQGLGIAECLAGKWSEAVVDLTKAMELGSGRTEFTCFFLAMAHWQLGSRDEARKWYHQALNSRTTGHLDESQRLQIEAAELLGIDDDSVRAARARLYIRNSRWTEAAQEYAGMSDLLSSDDLGRRFEYVALHLLIKDMDGYRRLCAGMAEDDVLAGSAIAAYELARACALTDEPVFETHRIVRWAQQAAALGPEYPWHFHVLGLAYYRDGQFDLAIETLQKSLESFWQFNGTGTLNELVLAMAHQRLGHTAIAQRFFERAERRIRQIDAGAKPAKMPAPDWLEVQLLLPEATSLLKTPVTETGS